MNEIREFEIYFFEMAESYYQMAAKYAAEHRRAAAQEALNTARYWAAKCPAFSTQQLENNITNLEEKLY